VFLCFLNPDYLLDPKKFTNDNKSMYLVKLINIRTIICLIFFALSFLLSNKVIAQMDGYKTLTVEAAGTKFKVFVFYPHNCSNTDILVLFHGLNRKAKSLRNKAVRIAQQECLIIFSPLFDKKRFPNWRYHRAGVFHAGQPQPRDQWTGPILQALLNQFRKLSCIRNCKTYLFGHSAGGQFLSRISAYSPPISVTSIVIANPSMYVLPKLQINVPDGFAGLFSDLEARRMLKEYLAMPISIYLGQADTGNKYLVKSHEAMRQGRTRLDRGRHVFQLARQISKDNGWRFNWKLIEVANVGHSSKGMLNAPELRSALRIYNDQI
jgi:poly(3-hydroxybutyrate) depolymerase